MMDEYLTAEAATIVMVIISLGLSVAGYIMAKRVSLGEQSDLDSLPTLAKRGSMLPLLIGKRLLAPHFTYERKLGLVWGWDTLWRKRRAGWHHICIGPVKAIHNIFVDGEPLGIDPSNIDLSHNSPAITTFFPITPETHPSGTSFYFQKLGIGYVFWGERDQPIDTSDASDPPYGGLNPAGALPEELGVASRWPHVCSVWFPYAPHENYWPDIKYETEAEVQQTALTLTDPYLPSSFSTLTHFDYPVTYIYTDSFGEQVLIVEIHPSIGPPFEFSLPWSPQPGDTFKVSDITNMSPHAFYTIKRVTWKFSVFSKVSLRIYVEGGLSNASLGPNAYARFYEPGRDDGYNPAHIISQLLFADFPHGLGKPQMLFDMESLEELGVIAQNERLACSVSITEGRTVEEALVDLLQDTGCLLTLDPYSGKYRFVPVRDTSTSSVPHINADLLLPPAVEVASVHRVGSSERVLYAFTDRANNYKDMTIGGFDNNGEMELLEYARAKIVNISTATSFTTATIIANRRSQEDLGGGAVYTIKANRESRLITAGRAFTIEGFDQQLLCTTVEIDPLDEAATITAISNYYGVVSSTDSTSPGGNTGGSGTPGSIPDIAIGPLEVPVYLLPYGPLSIVVARIRYHVNMQGAQIWLSDDNATYSQLGTENNPCAGGVLLEALPAVTTYLLEEGPTFTELGVDVAARSQDLSADPAKWRRGSQIMLLGAEMLFVRTIEYVEDTTWQLKGIIRARYGTLREDHAISDTFFLFDISDFTQFNDPLLLPDRHLWVKSQPHDGSAYVSLVDCEAVPIDIYGNSIKPQNPNALRVSGNNNFYTEAASVSFKWSYTSGLLQNTGAGTVNAGSATGTAAVVGSFELIVLTAADVVQATYTRTRNDWTYTAANMLTDFGSYPSSFKLQVRNTNGGYKSDPVEITVEKVV